MEEAPDTEHTVRQVLKDLWLTDQFLEGSKISRGTPQLKAYRRSLTFQFRSQFSRTLEFVFQNAH